METKTDIIIVGAGPVALFTVFEAGLLGLECVLIDNPVSYTHLTLPTTPYV